MNKYLVDDDKIKDMAETFNTSRDSVKKVNALYQVIHNGMKKHYLAHVIRTVEDEVRKSVDNPHFQIRCVPVADPKLSKFGSAQYYEKQLYLIFYNPHQDEKQLRILIAHELGHLVIETMAAEHGINYSKTEPVSSIFGLLTILDKNDFYENKTVTYQHSSWQEMLSDFTLLKNQSEEIFNISK